MVHVQQRALGALEEDARAALHLPREVERHITHVGPQPLAQLEEVRVALVHVQLRGLIAAVAAQLAQLVAHARQPLRDARAQALGVEQVPHADAPARHLVLVGRTDAAPRGADGALAPGLLTVGVQQLVPREDDVRVVGDEQVRVILEEAALLEGVDLLDEHGGIQHHPVADDARLARMEDARGDQVQHRLLAPHHERVPGVVAPLEAHHHLGVLREQVHDLALPLVSPLRSDDDHIRHSGGPLSTLRHAPSWDWAAQLRARGWQCAT